VTSFSNNDVWGSLASAAESHSGRLQAGYNKWPPSFVSDYIKQEELAKCLAWRDQIVADGIEALIVIGMGGSSLGSRAIENYLGARAERELFFFEGSHPQTAHYVDRLISRKRCAILWVSKSGSTLESRANLSLLRQKQKNLPETFVTSSPDKIADLQPAPQSIFAIPDNLGGRFSAISAVGILPTLFIGGDAHAFVQGFERGLAKWAIDRGANAAATLATHYHALLSHEAYVGIVFWVYARELILWGDWLLQLWGESIGKHSNVTALPLLAKGPEDQHSMLQYFLDGPNNLLHNFVFSPKLADDIVLGDNITGDFAGKNLSAILLAQKQSIVLALNENDRPVGQFELAATGDLADLGEWMCFWMFVISYLGYLYEVNPFDQPAVEQGKIYCTKLLSDGAVTDPMSPTFTL